MLYVVVVLIIRQYAFVVRLDIQYFCSSSLSTNILGIGIKTVEIYYIRASLKTRLIKEKTDRCGSCKETFRRRAAALRGRFTQQMSCIAVFFSKGVFRDAHYKIAAIKQRKIAVFMRLFWYLLYFEFFIASQKYCSTNYTLPKRRK